MRRAALPLVIASLLLLAGCTAPLQTTSASTADSAGTTIDATGVGTVSTAPDLAVVSLSVVATADSPDEARSDVADRTDQLLSALDDAGVPEDNVTTTGYSLSPVYDYSGDAREITGYRAVHSFRVEIVPDEAGTVVDTAVSAAAAEVNGVQFTLSDETRAALREQAIEQAVDHARTDADAAASAAGLDVTGVHSMQVGSSGPYYPVAYESAARGGDAGTSFRPGEATVTVTVQVTYTAE